MVTAVVTHDGACAGAVGPFDVDVPWWAEVESVVAHLEQVLGGPAVVLRRGTPWCRAAGRAAPARSS